MNRDKFLKALAYNKQHPLSEDAQVVLVEELQKKFGLTPDGMYGTKTQGVVNSLIPPDAKPLPTWPPFKGPLTRLPIDDKEVDAIFGNPGDGEEADPRWVKNNIMECHKKWDNQLPGVPEKFFVHVHKIFYPYLFEGLRRAQIVAPNYKIERLGCYVYRKIRDDPDRKLSRHARGIACDINAPDNPSHEFVRGKAPAPWSPAWNKLWPNPIPKEFVDAMRSVGMAWGGTWSNKDYDTSDNTYIDPPHFELFDWQR